MIELSAAQLKLLEQQMAEEGIDLSLSTLIPRLDDRSDLKLSFAQQQLWLLDQLEPGNPAYNLAAAMRLTGDLNVDALNSALSEIERRHEALRTTFTSLDGRPRQIIHPPRPSPLDIIDLETLPPDERQTEAKKLAAKEALHSFDLSRGPLFRVTLLRLNDREHILVLTMHHIISDGWSIAILWRELSAFYSGFLKGESSSLPKPSVQYADYAAWQREQLTDEVLAKEVDYWRDQLAGAPPLLQLPLARPRPAVQRSGEAALTVRLDQEPADALRKFNRAEGVTMFMTLAAAFALLLSRLSGQEEVVMGAPVARRNRKELEDLIGFFINSVVLRADLRSDPEFRELLRRTRDMCLSAYAHQEVPLEKIIECLKPKRDQSHTPIFQVYLNLLSYEIEEMRLPGIDIEHVPTPLLSKFDLTLYVVEGPAGIRLRIIYNPDLFDEVFIAELLEQMRSLCLQIVREPSKRISQFSLVTPKAAELLPDPSKSIDSSWQGSVQELFTRNARHWPDHLAVKDARETFTYAELDARSNQLATCLLAHGIKRHDIVAIYGHRSASLAWAILGTLKAGAVFCVLDPAHPDPRVIEYLNLAKPRAWLQVQAAGAISPAIEERVKSLTPNIRLTLSRNADVLANYSVDDPAIDTGPDDIACLTFTSGSTGEPKGILGRHQSLSHYGAWIARTFKIDDIDRFSMLSNLSHDPLQRDIFTPLQLGAALCIPDQEEIGTPGGLAEWMDQERITACNLTPPMIRLLTQTAAESCEISSLRHAFVVGDVLTKSDVARLRALAPSVTCVNLYGTTETQRALGYYIVPPETSSEKESTPIGKGIDEVELLVLNTDQKLCGIGELGEVYVRSPHLAHGYLDDTRLTRERFITNPFTSLESDRLYRTGDLGRYLSDGNVELSGRSDQQVQIRGFRVEPAEVESALKRNPAVNDCVVIASDGVDGEKQLVAYVVPANDAATAAGELTQSLRERLPAYMIPTAFVTMNSLPLTPNGKLDRQALPPPDHASAEVETRYVGPRTPTEEMVAGIVSRLVNIERVGVNDNFFDIGGHSLLAMQLIARLRAAFPVSVPLRNLFDIPTVAGLAAYIEHQLVSATEAPPITRVADDPKPLMSISQEAWLLREWWEDLHHLPARPSHEALAFRVSGELDHAVLEQAVNELIRRHEVLRTAFPKTRRVMSWRGLSPLIRKAVVSEDFRNSLHKLNNKLSPPGRKPSFLINRKLVISAAETLRVRLVDLQQLGEGEKTPETSRLIHEEIRRPLDIGRSPLLRVTCIKLAPREYVVCAVMHHIICDGLSKQIFLRDLLELYDSVAEAKPCVLPELSIQYSDFSRWQREWLRGETLESAFAYWWEQFRGVELFPELALPFANPAPPRCDFQDMEVQFATIDSTLHQSLQRLAQQQSVTLYMLLMGVLKALLYRYTGREKIRIFAPFANRTRVETQDVIGWFANTHVLRTDCRRDISFSGLLKKVRETVLGAYAHQETPYSLIAKMLKTRDGSYQIPQGLVDLPYIFFDFNAYRPRRAQSTNLDVTVIPSPVSGDGGVEVRVREHAGGMELNIKYSPVRIAPVHITRMLADFKTLLQAVVNNPDSRLDELPLTK